MRARNQWLEDYLFMFLIMEMKDEMKASVRDFYRGSLLTATTIVAGMYIVFVATFVAKAFGVILHPADKAWMHGPLMFAFFYVIHWLGYNSIGHEAMQLRMDSATEVEYRRAHRIFSWLILATIVSGALIVFFW